MKTREGISYPRIQKRDSNYLLLEVFIVTKLKLKSVELITKLSVFLLLHTVRPQILSKNIYKIFGSFATTCNYFHLLIKVWVKNCNHLKNYLKSLLKFNNVSHRVSLFSMTTCFLKRETCHMNCSDVILSRTSSEAVRPAVFYYYVLD